LTYLQRRGGRRRAPSAPQIRDEARRTQRGNNNADNQDNEISWLDWDRVRDNDALVRFWRLLTDFRKRGHEPAVDGQRLQYAACRRAVVFVSGAAA
jgi:pullulanase/glycogen debranching enzyme